VEYAVPERSPWLPAHLAAILAVLKALVVGMGVCATEPMEMVVAF
jgi:hypothetical protein